jgi:hypothetical protein
MHRCEKLERLIAGKHNLSNIIFRAIVRALRVVAGEHSLNNVSGLEQNRDVAFYSMHPRYTPSTWEDDIALIVVRLRSLTEFCLYFSKWNL